MGEIVTFYSYKGGTGRTMALANLGHILAWGLGPPRRVLMIDWDLEAPGLHKFFCEQLKINFSYLDIEVYPEKLEQAPGLIDFLAQMQGFYEGGYPDGQLGVTYAETPEARTAFAKALSAQPLAKYTLKVDPPHGGRASSDAATGLFLIKAGNQTSPRYTDLVRNFGWETFYAHYGSFFTHFREYLTGEYDLVLIDSRTGLTDIGDICTRVMPEKLVGVFVPNEQNIGGLIGVVRGAAEHRQASRDPRGLVIFPLASRIDSTRSLLRTAWWKGGSVPQRGRDRRIVGYEPRFEELIKSIYGLEDCDLDRFFDATQIPYDSDYSFGEDLATRDEVSDRLTISYSCTNLARYLVADVAPWEPLPDEARQASAFTESSAPISELLPKYFWPAVVGLAGALIVVLAPIFLKPNLGWQTVVTYRWSVALAAMAVGGSFLGFAVRGVLVVRSGFRSPSLGTRLLINAMAIVISIALAVAYWSVVSSLAVPTPLLTWSPLVLLAAAGPLGLYWSLRKIAALVSSPPATPQAKS